MLSPRYSESWALVIGINVYNHASPLAFARFDAEAVAKCLTGDLGFDDSKVITLLDANAPRAAIMQEFLRFDCLAPDDRLNLLQKHPPSRERRLP